MGLNDSNHTSKTYLNIVGGQLARRYKEHHEVGGQQVTIAREIKDKQGNLVKTVIERYYESVDGFIREASIDTSGDFGSKLVLELVDGDEAFTVQIPLESSYGRSVMLRTPNIDPELEVTIRPYSFESDGKKQTGVTIYQKNKGWDGDKVPYKWTKDNPGSMPEWEVTEVAGKKKWNSDKQTNFLAKHFEQWAKGIGAIETPTPSSEEDILAMEQQYAEEQAAKKAPETNGMDDLPF